LYGKTAMVTQRKRYSRLMAAVERPSASSAMVVISAPGRTELGGNHTDHNHGRVLAAAVDLDCVAMAVPAQDRQVEIHSAGYPEPILVDLSDLAPRPAERGRPEAFVRGVAAGLADMGCRIGGLAARVDSTVLPGSGLSSSAAFGVLLGGIFNHLFNAGTTAALDLARVAQRAENEFFGKPCGLMDQLASALGGVVHLDFAPPDAPDVEPIDVDFTKAGYQLTVVNTGGSHAELTPAYTAITREMQAVASAMGKKVLRGLTMEEIIRHIPQLRPKVGDRAILRSLHFIEENQRVEIMVDALRHNRMDTYLTQVAASGNSSWQLLQNCASASDPHRQGILLALTMTKRFLNGKGACRVHGGGFEGTIQAYVPRAQFDDYRSFMERVFGAGSVQALTIRRAGVARVHAGGVVPAVDGSGN
jgi:galactokinase